MLYFKSRFIVDKIMGGGGNMPSIMPISDLRNYTDLRRAEERANREGWIDADDFDREMGIID